MTATTDRPRLHFILGAITYYVVFPFLYCHRIYTFVRNTWQMSATAYIKQYRPSKFPATEKQNLLPFHNMQRQLQELEASKHERWTRITIVTQLYSLF